MKHRKTTALALVSWFLCTLAAAPAAAEGPAGAGAGSAAATSADSAAGAALDAGRLCLEQKIAQMVMMGFSGTQATDPVVADTIARISRGELGGVILYAYNIENPAQVKSLNAAFTAANPFSFALPIAVDQEGGLVQRLKVSNGFFSTPSAEAMAAEYSAEGAALWYQAMADMIADAGFTWNFGPVVDLRGYPDDPERHAVSPVIGRLQRSFSEHPDQVFDYAAAFVRAHRARGIATALKHYPGHGLAGQDSHLGLVDITDTRKPVEREPFRLLIGAGLADAVMTAHLVDRRVDPDNPVTLSPGFMDRELRGADGFGGVVVTDDLHMGAIQLYHGFDEIVVKAIQAGDDILIFSNNPGAAKNVPGWQPDYQVAARVVEAVKAAITRGELSEERIEASWQRIRALREGMKR
jgi:beta-N-acetylhexosaminidase